MKPVRFEILDHPADIGLRVWGRDRKELFEHAAVAFGRMIVGDGGPADGSAPPPPGAARSTHRDMELRAEDTASLFVEWLREILYLLDTEMILPVAARVDALSETELRATVEMRPLDPERCQVAPKAVTYHQLSVAETAEGWQADVYFDI